ncbi:CMP-N-acetylneuraminate-beta-1,4-galactoside alpha-2,3-sialyltransferase isoform X2 [Strongylocentrotus purpuratus]|uniref:Uncharacterized protein n=1 Tax=Strongylocentrotus purpuratus TaxID=7668 RepID=A0A7M7N808_STRPU|nr:CMP-N-acetylneuraminate-beta-1,4-galactoside alpha-2,3-sialyltransferase isoform X2 [Strongylocentrotus purpuratus]
MKKDCECCQLCTGCTRPKHPCMISAMNILKIRIGILRKVLILGIVLVTISLLYFVRPLQETHVSRSYISSENDGEVGGGKQDGVDYDVQSEFMGVLPRVLDSAKRSGVVSHLRSLIGLGWKDNSGTSSKTEIKFDSHAERLLDILEVNLFQNKTNAIDEVTVIKPSRKEGIHRSTSDEGEIPVGDGLQCIPGKSRDRMLNLFGNGYDANLHPFIGSKTGVSGVMSLPPPFGFRKSESALIKAVTVVGQSDFPTSNSCSRCVVVGNGGVMKQSAMGPIIDDFDVVIRLNDAPTVGYEKDVGSKTTIRMAYPESSFQSSLLYKGNWLYVIVIFKQADLLWVADVAAGKKAPSLKFWKSVARAVPKPSDEFRIFNPLIIRETAELVGMKVGNGKVGKNVPTTGSFAISMATRLCDEVSVAGFGYDVTKPLHYYDKLQMKIVKESWTHNIDIEKKWLLKMVQQGVIHDLTRGIK